VALPIAQLPCGGTAASCHRRRPRTVGFGQQRFGLAVFQVEALDGFLAIAFAQEEDLAGLACLQVGQFGAGIGRSTMRVSMPSKSMEIGATGATATLGSSRPVFGSTFGASGLARRQQPAWPAARLLFVAFLDQRRRQVAPQRRHPDGARHAVVFVLLREPVVAGPALVEAKKYRYLPLLSNTGSTTSDKPSVTCRDLFCSSE
jgi:hypothetical protein